MSEAEFWEAIQQGDRPAVEALLRRSPELAGARVGPGLSPALLALYYNEPEIAGLLVGRDPHVDVFTAAACGLADRLETLLSAQPDLANAVAGDGFQPLGLAAFFGQEAAVRTLLAHGARVDAPSHNPMRVMPLHSSVAHRHLDISRLLLEAGAPVNATQADDFTPLHEAAQNGQVAMLQLLLAYGADLAARKSDGKTPLMLAEEHGQADAAAFLRAAGAPA